MASPHLPKLRIVMTGPGHGSVFIDDVELPGVQTVSFAAGVDQISKVSVTMLAGEAEIEAPADVIMRIADELTLTLKNRG